MKIDGEYFLENPDQIVNNQDNEIAAANARIPAKKPGKVDQWIKKADNFLQDIGLWCN